jgi:uncharacterized Tic20 family protein
MTTGVPAPVPAPAVASAAPVATMPSQEDRLLAVVSHIAFLAGFWLVVPVIVYVVKRKESRFVAFQALQSAVLQVMFGVTITVGAVAWIVLGLFAGLSRSPQAGLLVTVVPALAMGAAFLTLLGIHFYAAFAAWQGRSWTLPFAGGIARAIMGADDGAAKT